MMFADRVQNLKGSAIREIFKLISQPDMISFAGGLPAPEMFPNEELAEISKDILINNGTTALQYSITEGYPQLRDKMKQRMKNFNIFKDEADELIIVSGGQQGIDLTAKVFLNEGDGIVVEEPSFIGALNAFRAYNAKMYPVGLESDGMDLVQLEKTVQKNKNIKLIYTIPTFQNPSGITMSLEKRKKLLEIADKYELYLIEDNPYGELRFEGTEIPPVKTVDTNNRVIYVGSFSKILSPGLRTGWVCGNKEILQKIVVVKQVNDVHTNVFAQMIALDYMEKYDLDSHIEKIRKLYGHKCNYMLECIDKYLPAGVKSTRPEGGLFIWCTLPENINSIGVMKKCVENKVAFVPGNTFMTDMEKPCSSFRLNYSTMSDEKIKEGINIIGNTLKEIL